MRRLLAPVAAVLIVGGTLAVEGTVEAAPTACNIAGYGNYSAGIDCYAGTGAYYARVTFESNSGSRVTKNGPVRTIAGPGSYVTMSPGWHAIGIGLRVVT
jgi:hypothetical protein